MTGLRIDVFTIFPDYFAGPLDAALLGRARRRGLLEVRLHDPRDWTEDRHRTVDDAPFGGGPGMVMMAEPLFRAVEGVGPPRPLFLLAPGGRRFDQDLARELAGLGTGFSLLCGRYEGVDQRVADHLCDDELSVGDYVLAGGEAAALVVVEAVVRLVPEVMGNEASAGEESFTLGGGPMPPGTPGATSRSPGAGGLLEYPQYTRPAEFRGWAVPEVLRSGDHRRIARWRHEQALRRTARRRPDLLETAQLSDEERALVEDPAPE